MIEDLTGSTNGFLTYIKESGTLKGNRMIECLCACGQTSVLQAASYISGLSKSCGCYFKTVSSQRMVEIGKRNVKNIIPGQTFYYWTVIERDSNPPSQMRAYWRCVCKCGKEQSIVGSVLRAGKSKSCGCYRSELRRNREANKVNHNDPN